MLLTFWSVVAIIPLWHQSNLFQQNKYTCLGAQCIIELWCQDPYIGKQFWRLFLSNPILFWHLLTETGNIHNNLVTSPIRNAEMAMANLTHISSSLEESQNFLSKTGATWALETFLAFPNLIFFLPQLWSLCFEEIR